MAGARVRGGDGGLSVPVLAIESATGAASVAIAGADGALLATAESTDARAHVEFLMPAIERICVEAGVRLKDLRGIAVDVGPGAFTGLRIGVTTAKALAQTLGITVTPVGSLAALAARANDERVWTCVDARRGRVYACEPGADARAFQPAELAHAVGSAPIIGDAPYDELRDLAWIERVSPHARDVLTAARTVDPLPPEVVEPIYLRDPDAGIDWEGQGAIIQRPDRVKIAGER